MAPDHEEPWHAAATVSMLKHSEGRAGFGSARHGLASMAGDNKRLPVGNASHVQPIVHVHLTRKSHVLERMCVLPQDLLRVVTALVHLLPVKVVTNVPMIPGVWCWRLPL